MLKKYLLLISLSLVFLNFNFQVLTMQEPETMTIPKKIADHENKVIIETFASLCCLALGNHLFNYTTFGVACCLGCSSISALLAYREAQKPQPQPTYDNIFKAVFEEHNNLQEIFTKLGEIKIDTEKLHENVRCNRYNEAIFQYATNFKLEYDEIINAIKQTQPDELITKNEKSILLSVTRHFKKEHQDLWNLEKRNLISQAHHTYPYKTIISLGLILRLKNKITLNLEIINKLLKIYLRSSDSSPQKNVHYDHKVRVLKVVSINFNTLDTLLNNSINDIVITSMYQREIHAARRNLKVD